MPQAHQAREHIGSRIKFLFYPGWEEPEEMTGWLHHVTVSDPHDQDQLVWLHIDDAQTLSEADASGLGGYGMHPTETFEII